MPSYLPANSKYGILISFLNPYLDNELYQPLKLFLSGISKNRVKYHRKHQPNTPDQNYRSAEYPKTAKYVLQNL